MLVSDGGDGFLDCIEVVKSSGEDKVERVAMSVDGPMPDQITEGSFLLNKASKTAYIEAANLNGL